MIKIKTDENIGSIKNAGSDIKEARYTDVVVWQEGSSEITITVSARIDTVKVYRFTRPVGAFEVLINEIRQTQISNSGESTFKIKKGDSIRISHYSLQDEAGYYIGPAQAEKGYVPLKNETIICTAYKSGSA